MDRQFTITKGNYQGNASWSVNVWTLINEMIVRGLLDCGENELAEELALKTLCSFKSNCAEFINPFDGSGNCAERYARTASPFTELIVEVIFGASYNAAKKEIAISPKLPHKLRSCSLALKDLKIDSDIIIDIHIENGNVSCMASDKNIKAIT